MHQAYTMDKEALPSTERQSKQIPPALSLRQALFIVAAFLLSGYSLSHAAKSVGRTENRASSISDSDFDWSRIPSHRHLTYHPCFQTEEVSFECARLSVPLDHFNHTTTTKISLAVIRLPAPVPPSHPRYGGAILFNPGGPGGSGVDFLQRGWKSTASAIHHGQDANDTSYYDFISFDPRGVANSSPMVSCFGSTGLSWAWALRTWEQGIFGSSDAAFGRLFSMSQALGGSCSLSADTDPEDIKKFVSTAYVAADMNEIIESHGEWREAEARRLLALDGSKSVIPKSLKHNPGKEKINYWGFSYGTLLGMTFASMYPERISRFIIDGVVDAEDYIQALWFDNLADTEKEMRSFYDYCASAGYPACALANKTRDSNGTNIEARVSSILDSLVHNPLPVIGDTPEIITYSDVKHLIFAGLYNPLASFPLIADVLVEIEEGNGTRMADRLRSIHEPPCLTSTGTKSVAHELLPRSPVRRALSGEASISIACSDGDPQSSSTRQDIRDHWRNLTELSPTAGPMWAMFRMRCAHYPVRPLYRYDGPWIGNTSFPILLIGNSADPVTPVRNAHKMAKGYKDARVLEQGSSGHCSLAAPSRCTREVVYRYFQHGELPEHGLRCAADEYPFGAVSPRPYSLDEALGQYRGIGPAGALMPVIV